MAVLPKAQMNQFYINQKNVGAPYCFIPVPGIQKGKKIVSESWSFAEQLDTKK
jgi:hypothetical protein